MGAQIKWAYFPYDLEPRERDRDRNRVREREKKSLHISGKTCAILKQWALDKCTYLLAWEKLLSSSFQTLISPLIASTKEKIHLHTRTHTADPLWLFHFGSSSRHIQIYERKRWAYVRLDFSLINCGMWNGRHTESEMKIYKKRHGNEARIRESQK